MGDLSKNFDSKEFFSKDVYQKIKSSNREPKWYIDKRLVEILEDIRKKFGKVTINTDKMQKRGFRTPAENYEAGGGGEWGLHCFGRAVDFNTEKGTPKEVQDYLRKKYNDIGLGCSDKFTHIDTRNTDTLIEWRY